MFFPSLVNSQRIRYEIGIRMKIQDSSNLCVKLYNNCGSEYVSQRQKLQVEKLQLYKKNCIPSSRGITYKCKSLQKA